VEDPLNPFYIDDAAKLDDPFADLAWLRENRPVHFHEPSGQWFVFGYDDVRALFSDPRLSNDRMGGFADSVPVAVHDDIEALVPFFGEFLIMRDGEPHLKLRHQLHAGFNPQAITALHDPIRRAAEELINRRRPHGTLDLSADFGLLLPAFVLSDFIGAPVEDRDHLVRWSLDFVDFFNEIPISEGAARRMAASSHRMIGYTRDLLAERRLAPQHDFLSTMATLSGQSGGITETEIVANTMLLLLAGHIAVRNLLGNVVWELIQHPAEGAAVRADLGLLPAAIEETLRHEPPVTLIARISTAPIEVRDHTIPSGAVVQLGVISANRDPSVFPDPDRFSVARDPRGTLSFGHGPHGCLGARLARELAQISLSVLYEKLGELRVVEDAPLRWYRNAGNRGPEELHVTWGS
jgi:cytochrome P450